jgi:hypothetical protein
MKTNLFNSLLAALAWLGTGLALDSAAPRAWAQGATFLSATPQTPITLGESLNITVAVRNNTGDDWLAGELGASWLTEMDQPSWLPGAQQIDFYTITTVPDGTTASMIVTLPPESLPVAPGSYSVRLYTAYNLWDLDFYLMTGGPKTVNFTINAAATNHPPVLSPLGDMAVVVTNLLSLTVTALDTDLPPQTLTFNLEPGAPAEASINSSNGLFTWTPSAGLTPRTNQISVRVTDNGAPALSSTNSFQVVVLPLPRFFPMSRPVDGVVSLTWPAFPGKAYRVRYRDQLTVGAWTNLGADLVATNGVGSATDDPSASRQRFYQVLLLD